MSIDREVIVFDDKTPKNSHPLKNPFLGLLIGSIGQGKTNLMLNILQELDEYYNRIILFSQNKVDTKLNLLSNGIEIYDADLEILNNIIEDVIQTQQKFKQANKKMPEVLFIFDDLIANKDFFPSGPKGNKLINFILSLRHYRTSVLITAQQYTAIPKKIRLNAQILFVFKLSDGDFKDILKETNFPKQKFKEAFDRATTGKHDFLYINLNTRELFKNFKQLL